MDKSFMKEPRAWRAGSSDNRNKWTCLACQNNHWDDRKAVLQHEKSHDHKRNVADFISQLAGSSQTTVTPVVRENVGGIIADVLDELANPQPVLHQPQQQNRPSNTTQAGDLDYDAMDFGSFGALDDPNNHLQDLFVDMSEWLADPASVINQESDNEEEFERRVNEEDAMDRDRMSRPRQRRQDEKEENPQWFPWDDKITCVVDILRHLPRSIFSDDQMDIILWSVENLGIDHVPSVKTMKEIDNMLQAFCGFETKRYKGALGHVYYVNDLAAIIAQEMANPRIRPHLRHYPEDSGPRLSECHQAQRWLNELDPSLASPMLRVRSQDYYVSEPAKLRDGRVVVPERWFTRKIQNEEHFFMQAYTTNVVQSTAGLGYEVLAHNKIVVPASDLSLAFPRLCETFRDDMLPDPRRIFGIRRAPDSGLEQWTLTDPSIGNKWRKLAYRDGRAHRTLCFPMWMYCDDTSGNVSKKWNKHNSFLFTAAGLPHNLTQKESNIHFLSTSNLAPPLEMLDGIVEQLDRCQEHGIWAWDSMEKEMVLMIPVVLALLGDNPMQSEFACHIGLRGKLFCRSCWVAGQESIESTSGQRVPQQSGSDTGQGSAQSNASQTQGIGGGRKKPGGRRKETLAELADRARRFLSTVPLRSRDESLRLLQNQFAEASRLGGKTRYGQTKTATGLKDNMLDHFADKIFSFSRRLKGRPNVRKQEDIDEFIDRQLPKDPFSPVWRIKDLDPHKDTLVEILHVILLGFIKYFWRDAISRLDDTQKELLITRLNSIDVSGLGISPLSGDKLVRYAGSLTGTNFRAITQVAPFVLYDLVPQPCYAAWLALSTMVPLVWQPVIEDLNQHIEKLEAAIRHFLICTARWTLRWFNKPKFHILLHLPNHIRRFGPAILFATEAFESFNAIIRDHSVHSNRLAPSRDIGRGMARCSRNRHLLSGGYFIPRSNTDAALPSEDSNDFLSRPFSNDSRKWRTAGPAPLILSRPGVVRCNALAECLGFLLPPSKLPSAGSAILKPSTAVRDWRTTQLSAIMPNLQIDGRNASFFHYRICKSVFAANGDECSINAFVLVSPEAPASSPVIGKVAEILQVQHSDSEKKGLASFVVLQEHYVQGSAAVYGFPLLRPYRWKLLDGSSLVCHVNVQHNCSANMCDTSDLVVVREEREDTDKTRPAVHHNNPYDVMLNTAQMRDSAHVKQLRFQTHRWTDDETLLAIHTGAVAEFEDQASKSSTTASNAAARSARAPNPSPFTSSSALTLVINQ